MVHLCRQVLVADALVQEKANCRVALARLRELKPDVENLQLLIEKGKRTLQQDFEVWHSLMLRRRQPRCTSVDRTSRFYGFWFTSNVTCTGPM